MSLIYKIIISQSDSDPIEETFAELKAWMQKNYMLAENFKSFEELIEITLRHMASKPGNHFRSCFIQMLLWINRVP
jgi:hypothetical protein